MAEPIKEKKESKYKNVEAITELLDEKHLGKVRKRLISTERSVLEILKKLSALETQKAERAAEEAAKAAAEAEEKARAEEAAAKAAEEAAKLAEEAAKTAQEEVKPTKKKTAKKAAEETPVVEVPVEEAPKAEEKPVAVEEPKAEEKPVAVEAPKAEEPKAKTEKPTLKTYKPEEKKLAPRNPRVRRIWKDGKLIGEEIIPEEEEKPRERTPRPQGEDRRKTPMGDRPARPQGGGSVAPAPMMPTSGKTQTKKKTTYTEKTYSEKKPLSKRTLIKQQGMSVEDFDEDKTGYRKVRQPKKQKQKEIPVIKIEHAVVTTQEIPLKVLSEKLGVSAVEITKRLFKEGIMKGINDSIDYDNAALMAADMGIDLEYKPEKTAEDVLNENVTDEDTAKLVTRAPVVTVMGHVDHGKTSLLDKIRSTSVTAGEAGGITQSIGAYTVTCKGKQITFIDTPGHAAFTAMRARGAQVTDVVILVVAADDGIMPQTVEAINHAKAANVPIIVAMNKMDKHEINPDRVKQGLIENDLVPEEWGGDTMIVPVSAKTGMGIDELLESVNLVAEMQELKANPDRQAKGTIIEAKLDKGKGPVASIIVQTGTLKTGDNILSGTTMGRVRAMFDDKGRTVKSAGPSMAVSILGFEEVPNAGDSIMAVDQALMKQVQEERKNKERENMIKQQTRVTLDDVFAQVEEGKMKTLNLIVKGDVQGSVEAVKQSLEKIKNEEVRIKVIHAAAGAINESDIMLADSANAISIGFNVRPDTKAKKLAESSKVDVRSYRIIYELLDDMEAALKGMLAPKLRETLTGKCEVRQTFNISGVGTIAGCYVTDGKIVRGGKLRIYREDIMICEGGVKQLKRFKDDVKEVSYGFECGCAIDGFNEIRIGDIIECYITEEIKS